MEHIASITEVADEIKEKISDAEYMEIMEQLKKLHEKERKTEWVKLKILANKVQKEVDMPLCNNADCDADCDESDCPTSRFQMICSCEDHHFRADMFWWNTADIIDSTDDLRIRLDGSIGKEILIKSGKCILNDYGIATSKEYVQRGCDNSFQRTNIHISYPKWVLISYEFIKEE